MNANAMLIVVGLIGIAIGFALGVALMSLRSPQSENKRAAPRIQARTPRNQARGQTPPPEAVPASDEAPTPIPTQAHLTADPTPSTPRVSNTNPVNILARVLQPGLSSVQEPPKSIAAQIDEILQEMLEGSPMASRGIRLMEFPNRGLVVMVGLDQYEGVDLVPDDDIRQLIRSAVEEWERRNTPSS